MTQGGGGTMSDKGETGIRPYGPGKFSTMLDAYVYDVSLDSGTDEECGDSSWAGRWYGLMRGGRSIFKNGDPACEELTEEERNLLFDSAGVIVSESSDGFVDVDYYDTDTELDAAWAVCLSECEECEEEG